MAMGTNDLLEKLIAEQRRTNELLALQVEASMQNMNHRVDVSEIAMRLDEIQDPRYAPPAPNVQAKPL